MPHDHSQTASDHTLLEGTIDDCPECFALIFYRYCDLVFHIALRILHNGSEAEDIVQEVFLAIFQQRYKYDQSRGTVRTWICQFAHFKALMTRRSLGVRKVQAFDETAGYCEEAPNENRNTLNIQTVIRSVESALRLLNERQQRAIELIHFEGYTLLETATILEESLANTRNLYYRGMNTMATTLRPARSSGETADRRRQEETAIDTKPLLNLGI